MASMKKSRLAPGLFWMSTQGGAGEFRSLKRTPHCAKVRLRGGFAAEGVGAVGEGGGVLAAFHLHALKRGPELALEVGVALVQAGGFLEAFHGEVELGLAAVDQAEAVVQVGVLGANL